MFKKLLNHSVDVIPWWLRNVIKKIPLLSSIQKIIMQKYLYGSEFIYRISAGPAKGLNFPIKLPEDKLYWTGTWEQEITETIYNNVVSGTASYDIGGHRGFVAGIMALAGSSTVYCFEPNPDNIRHIEKLIQLNSDLNIKLEKCAVSECDGEAEFSLMQESSMGKLSNSSFQSDVKGCKSIKVKTRSIDSMLESHEISEPGLIKIDVEGAELLVLKGAENTIKKYWPRFVIELHSFSLAHDCIKYLENSGYKTQIIQKDIDLGDSFKFRVCHLLATKDA